MALMYLDKKKPWDRISRNKLTRYHFPRVLPFALIFTDLCSNKVLKGEVIFYDVDKNDKKGPSKR